MTGARDDSLGNVADCQSEARISDIYTGVVVTSLASLPSPFLTSLPSSHFIVFGAKVFNRSLIYSRIPSGCVSSPELVVGRDRQTQLLTGLAVVSRRRNEERTGFATCIH